MSKNGLNKGKEAISWKRTLYEALVKWKNAPDRKPLVVEGARQVGKTWLIKEFGENEFENMVYLNCDNNPDLESLFQDYDNRVLRVLTALTGQPILAGKTLIVFDEVQELPRGLAALNYFYENAPEYNEFFLKVLSSLSPNLTAYGDFCTTTIFG